VPAALLAHERQSRLCDPQGAEQIRLELVARLLLAELLDHPELAVAGIVDDNVEPAETLVRTTVSNAEPRSVTSSASASAESGWAATRSSSALRSRAVAATLSPRSSAAFAHSRPKPREVPVMNQVRAGMRAILHRGG